MASSYDNDLRLNEQGTGDNSGSWGTVTNLNLEIIAEAFSYGTRAIANASTDNITLADGASDADRSMYLKLTGGGQACTVTFLPATISKVWLIENATSATLTFTQGSGANVAVLAGQVKMIATDGAGSGAIVYDLLTDVNLAGTTVMSGATIDDVAIDGKVITLTGSAGDTATLTVAANGALAIATTDAAAAAANISITADGTFTAAATTITLDSAGAIVLDADSGVIQFKDGGTTIGSITNSSSDLVIKSNVQDKDILLQGDDGGTGITALTLDMSAGGNALFSGTVTRDLTRGSIDVGNSSGVSAPLAAGGADTVLTSDGTDLSWAAADTGAAFAGATVTVTADTTLSAGQNGNLIRVTATSVKTINLPATATGLFYVFSSESAVEMYIKPNGTNTINGNSAGVNLVLAAGASGIVSCGTAGTNWSSVGMVKDMIIHKATTFYNSATSPADPARVTGTYTTTLGTQILICVGSASASAPYGAQSNDLHRSAASGGPSYGEKFISSPASSYAYEICGGGYVGGPSSGGFDRTTKAGGITATRGADPASAQGTGNTAAKAGGTCSGGTVNFAGGIGTSGASKTGGGGGSGTRAGAGGNGNGGSTTAAGGGTGGNNASTSAAGAAATAKDSNSQAIANSTSETYLAGTYQANTTTGAASLLGTGAGPKTAVNFGSVSFTIADNDFLISGGVRGANRGGHSKAGIGGYVTFVEFI